MKLKIRLARSASECGGSGGIPRIQKDFPRFFRRELQSPFREEEGSMFSEHSKQKFCEPIFFRFFRVLCGYFQVHPNGARQNDG